MRQRLIFAVMLVLGLGTCCGAQTVNPARARSITLGTFQDPWASAQERWWDVGSYSSGGVDFYNQFNDWITAGAANGGFNYATNPTVTLTYDAAPAVPYFVGHIHATGLKPNFAYQLKLTGKPISGTRGFGTASSYVTASTNLPGATPILHPVTNGQGGVTPVAGDDWTSQQLGYAGRWWDDQPNPPGTNIDDSYYQTNYPARTVYGYLFMGDFFTDSHGNCDKDFTGQYSYHITFQDWQDGIDDVKVPESPITITGYLDSTSPADYYGYGPTAPATGNAAAQQNGHASVGLFYQYEPSRSAGAGVVLPNGSYHCRLLITEESFHNEFGGTNSALGGFWKTVLATEDFGAGGAPSTNAANFIAFSIGLPASPAGLAATPGNGHVLLNWTSSGGATSYNVKRATVSGGPYSTISSAGTVTGNDFTDSTVSNGTTYYYVVSAVDGVGESANSNQANATPSAYFVWTGGASDGLWTTAGNWASDSVPGAGDSALIGSGAAVTLKSAVSIGSLSLRDATLSGSGSLNVSEALNLSSDGTAPGAIAGIAVSIASKAVFNISGTGALTLNAPIVNAGELLWSGANVQLAGGAITNSGTLVILKGAGGSTKLGTATITNRGLISMSATGVIDFAATVNNFATFDINSGTLAIKTLTQQTGQTVIGGTLRGNIDLEGGDLVDEGIVQGNFFNGSAVTLGGLPAKKASLGVVGNYAQGAGARLNATLLGATPITGYTELNVSGTATLAGTLSIAHIAGGVSFAPRVAEAFTVINGGKIAGSFSQLSGVEMGGGIVLAPLYRPAYVELLAGQRLVSVKSNGAVKEPLGAATATATFTVQLSQAAAVAVTVRCATVDGTALAGKDYRAVAGTITFAPGVTSKAMTVTVLDNHLTSGTRTFGFALSDPGGASLGVASATGTIVGN